MNDSSSNQFEDNSESASAASTEDAKPVPLIVDEFGHPIGKAAEAQKIQSTQKEILDRVKTGERWMILLTAVVALTSVCQVVESCNNNRSTSAQIDKIIGPADHIGSAASSFSNSAQNINQGISNAVGKLDTQAQDMEKARVGTQKNAANALQAAIDNFHSQQRAWIAITSVHGTKPELNKPFNGTVEIKDTGPTPAKNIVMRASFSAYPKGAPVDFSFGLSEHKLGVLSPGGDRSLNSRLEGPKGLDQSSIDKLNSMDIYMYGIVRYDDIFGVHHWVTYCSQLSDDRSEYNFCEQHNDTDNDQK